MIKDYEKFQREGTLGVSCSSVNYFLTEPSKFFDIVLDRSPSFCNEATSLGTIVHHCASKYIENDLGNIKQEVLDYVNNLSFDIDKEWILTRYSDMANVLFEWIDKNPGNRISEKRFEYNLSDRVVLNGTCDLILDNKFLIDFKTTKQTSPKTIMPENYEMQLLSYIYLLQKCGISIDYAKLVFITVPEIGRISEKTGKPLKDYPATVYELGMNITQEKLDKIEWVMKLINDNINFFLDNEDKKYLITRNMEDFNGYKSIN